MIQHHGCTHSASIVNAVNHCIDKTINVLYYESKPGTTVQFLNLCSGEIQSWDVRDFYQPLGDFSFSYQFAPARDIQISQPFKETTRFFTEPGKINTANARFHLILCTYVQIRNDRNCNCINKELQNFVTISYYKYWTAFHRCKIYH
jgi:hypothetical protein